jgi:transcriptional regulator with XRE-family HTH domain
MTDEEAAFTGALGQCIRLLRLDQRLSQEQLTQEAGLSCVFVSSVERGIHAPNILNLRRIAEALKVPLAVIVAGPSPRQGVWVKPGPS